MIACTAGSTRQGDATAEVFAMPAFLGDLFLSTGWSHQTDLRVTRLRPRARRFASGRPTFSTTKRRAMNPFAQLVSPQALREAVEASAELRQLPCRSYRPLDPLQASSKAQPASKPAAAPKAASPLTSARPKWLPFTARWQ